MTEDIDLEKHNNFLYIYKNYYIVYDYIKGGIHGH